MAGTKRIRALGLVAATAAIVALGAGVAWAGEDVTANVVCCNYSKSTYFSDQGESANFINPVGSGTSHNVTAKLKGPDGKPLFRSKTIGEGKTSDIAGLKYLSGGSYKFYCTIHELSATYVVSDNKGTPVARPKIDVTLPSQALDKVRSSGKLSVKVKAPTQSAGVSLEARKGGKLLGTKTGLTLSAGASRTLTLSLTSSGRKALKGLTSAAVAVKGSVPFGKPDSASRTLR